ncbi:thermonuclease family protein [Paenibacillus sp. FSL K6-1096]|uniref:thermonuclease family protein n=1 Tax=Paenibacillus sp. FSL K6-1096 TaxID=2921460 RepID=UPI0030EF130A
MNKNLFIVFVVIFSLLVANHLESLYPAKYDDADVIATYIFKSEGSDNEIKTDKSSSTFTKKINAKVISVIDGDTFQIKVEDGGAIEEVKLNLIDAPGIQPVQPFGPEAKAFISKLLLGKTIILETDLSVRDEDGRILAFAYYENNIVNQMLLENGLARVKMDQTDKLDQKGVDYLSQFIQVQSQAQEAKLGIWSWS